MGAADLTKNVAKRIVAATKYTRIKSVMFKKLPDE